MWIADLHPSLNGSHRAAGGLGEPHKEPLFIPVKLRVTAYRDPDLRVARAVHSAGKEDLSDPDLVRLVLDISPVADSNIGVEGVSEKCCPIVVRMRYGPAGGGDGVRSLRDQRRPDSATRCHHKPGANLPQ